MSKQITIAGSTEILSAFLSADIGSATGQLKSDVSGFIAENYGVDLSATSISVVENTDSEMHLSLPYYTGLEQATAEAMADKDVDTLAGGFEIVIAIAIGAIAAGSIAAAAGVVGAGYGISEGVKASQRNGK